ncbi:MAG: hypothetical protein WC528_02215 [Patescibacteria group bacterium]
MIKIALNTAIITNFLKKYFFPLIFGIFLIVLVSDLIFIFMQIRNNPIDPSKIVSREQKIDQSAYDQVIERDHARKASDKNINNLNNPF